MSDLRTRAVSLTIQLNDELSLENGEDSLRFSRAMKQANRLSPSFYPTGAETLMAERRQVDRIKTADGALIFFDKQRGVRSCTVRDISGAGIGLRLSDQDVIDPVFKMTLDNFRNVQTCRVIWSRGRYIGATFDVGAEHHPISRSWRPIGRWEAEQSRRR